MCLRLSCGDALWQVPSYLWLAGAKLSKAGFCFICQPQAGFLWCVGPKQAPVNLLANNLYARGSSKEAFRQFSFAWKTYFFWPSKHQKNRQRMNNEKPNFWQHENTLFHACIFTIDLQRHWVINCRIGNHQGMLKEIQHALTIAICCFLSKNENACNNTHFLHHQDMCQLKLFYKAKMIWIGTERGGLGAQCWRSPWSFACTHKHDTYVHSNQILLINIICKGFWFDMHVH